ncbi:DUF5359 family protein [Caldibacillus debilis]|jgi:hypothetical protein|uniref:Uncharacterized protein n=1 Tax=Caldibacillus debilis GB1 TaxID=1339248 RepID=A0A420VES3_9BACI|nr:DUF5359 family protein [Caldibacillus debilis]RKO62119.1 hypothetical protein Cdeb_00853 [Caldibacillus debilis GB1]
MAVERVERILWKLAAVQLVLLLLCQILFHHFDFFPELKKQLHVEGVGEQNLTEIIETVNSR